MRDKKCLNETGFPVRRVILVRPDPEPLILLLQLEPLL